MGAELLTKTLGEINAVAHSDDEVHMIAGENAERVLQRVL